MVRSSRGLLYGRCFRMSKSTLLATTEYCMIPYIDGCVCWSFSLSNHNSVGFLASNSEVITVMMAYGSARRHGALINHQSSSILTGSHWLGSRSALLRRQDKCNSALCWYVPYVHRLLLRIEMDEHGIRWAETSTDASEKDRCRIIRSSILYK